MSLRGLKPNPIFTVTLRCVKLLFIFFLNRLNLFQQVQPQTQTIPTLRRRRTRTRNRHKQSASVAQRRSWPVSGMVVQSAPHVSIIDFNTLIRGGLELAIQRNNRRTRSSKPRNKKFRSRKAQSASQYSNDESDSPGC